MRRKLRRRETRPVLTSYEPWGKSLDRTAPKNTGARREGNRATTDSTLSFIGNLSIRILTYSRLESLELRTRNLQQRSLIRHSFLAHPLMPAIERDPGPRDA
jgi:hypothetical protein